MTSLITPLPFHEDKNENLWILGDKLFFALKPPSDAERESVKRRLGKDCIEVKCTIVSKCVVAVPEGKSEDIRRQAIKCYPDTTPPHEYVEADISIRNFVGAYCVQTPPYNDSLPEAVLTLFVRHSDFERLPSATTEKGAMEAAKAHLKNSEGFWVVQAKTDKFVAVPVARPR